ncbi:protein FAM169B isoform X5 [Pogona vitticeps]
MAAATGPRLARSASASAVHLYPVDIKYEKPEVLEAAAHVYYTKLLEESSSEAEFLCIPGKENIKLEASLMSFVPLYREDSEHKLLVLTDPQEKNKVLSVYLDSSWWLIEDIVKTADPSRESLMQVQTYAERIVLFVLNCIIFGILERNSTCDALFVPHSKEEHAKIFWKKGEAAAFYTVKPKGSLCDGHTGQCYLLPVLDTMFVQKKFRRRGLGMKMLYDFCQMFATEDALGLSFPVSPNMYRVCQKFLETYPEEQSRLWEVEAPGDWNQRVNIWLKIQLDQSRPKKVGLSSHIEKFQDDEPGQSDEGKMNQRSGHLRNRKTSEDEAKEFSHGPEETVNPDPHWEERDIQGTAKVQQDPRVKKRQSSGEAPEAPKHFKAMP